MLGVIARQGVSMSVDDVEAQIALSLPAFVARFPAETFCAASLDAVCATERFWNEARIIAALEAWRTANEPSGPALPAQAEAAPVSNEAKRWLASWYRAEDDRAAERALDLIRSYCDEAWIYLCREDTRAADIAVVKRWHVPGETRYWSETDVREAVHKAVSLRGGISRFEIVIGQIALNTLVQAVRVNAPQHGEALIEELRWVAAGKPSEPVPVAFPPSTEAGLFGD